MDTFNRTMLFVIQLVLFPDGSKSTAETLTCLLACSQSPYLNTILNLGNESERDIWELDPVPFNLKALETAIHQIGLKFLIPPINYS
ncbi:hypothetical protein TNCV_1807411 [Trichonephila clavipes]|nr:hypothetical protein TNCV_1807411 [Trichonephila clavipes]